MSSTSYTLTSAWTQIANAGQNVIVQNQSAFPMVLAASSSTPTATTGDVLGSLVERTGVASANLWARSDYGGSLVVSDAEFSGDGSIDISTLAKDATLGTLGTGAPALPGGSTGITGLLRGIWATLTGSLAVATPTPSTFFTKRIALTGSPIQLPSNALVNGLIGFADSGNTSRIYYGPGSAAVTAIDGSGDGFPVLPGASVADALSNSNAVWVNGASGTVFYVKGN